MIQCLVGMVKQSIGVKLRMGNHTGCSQAYRNDISNKGLQVWYFLLQHCITQFLADYFSALRVGHGKHANKLLAAVSGDKIHRTRQRSLNRPGDLL
ncbi:hypothetical protein LZ558_11125 [Methylobacter sp. YRD-M1]|nr:hypothetical protein [Methylobacter sp. YRD-M1]WAK00410.1 hypothetical protein LZ558_11125 [Methylobacter sp. YRD-M1]